VRAADLTSGESAIPSRVGHSLRSRPFGIPDVIIGGFQAHEECQLTKSAATWHTAVGATDNADAVSAAMEAMRILTALHTSPRRTIRVVLWGGERWLPSPRRVPVNQKCSYY
jgi:hypothetical protein